MPTTRTKAAQNAKRFKDLRSELYSKYNKKALRDSASIHEDIDWDAARSCSAVRKTYKASRSPLLTLPAELRNMIFSIALTEPVRLFLDTLVPPALACVSKQTRQEALPIFLAVNRFHILFDFGSKHFDIDFSPVTRSWLYEVGINTAILQDVIMSFTEKQDDTNTLVDHHYLVKAHEPSLRHDFTCLFCNGSAPPMIERLIQAFIYHGIDEHETEVVRSYPTDHVKCLEAVLERIMGVKSSPVPALSIHDLRQWALCLDEKFIEAERTTRDRQEILLTHFT